MPVSHPEKISQTAAIILAGGKSTRMGQDKALLTFGKESLLSRLVRVVNPLVDKVVIMLSQTLQLPADNFKYPANIIIGRDSAKEQGPLQGIADAMPYLPESTNYVFVLSCDLPFVTEDWLRLIRRKLIDAKTAEVVCSKQGDYLNPLIAIYQTQVIKQAPLLVAAGKRSCQALFDAHSVIPLESSPQNPDLLANINTPEEYQRALEKITRRDG